MGLNLTSQIVSSDTFQIFLQAMKDGIILGLLLAILVYITWWLWR